MRHIGLLLWGLLALGALMLAAGAVGFLAYGGASASPSAEISQTWEPNDGRPDRGCGGVDQEYADDPADATEHDIDVNDQGDTDRYIGRRVVKDDGTVKMYIEEWSIDDNHYSVRVIQPEKPDRYWQT